MQTAEARDGSIRRSGIGWLVCNPNVSFDDIMPSKGRGNDHVSSVEEREYFVACRADSSGYVCRAPAAAEDGQAQLSAVEPGTFQYVHDPRLNPKDMADIIEDPSAVYGFSPDPDSTRLGEFASYDWSDPELVESSRQKRIAYHGENAGLYAMLDELRAEGKTIEEIARTLSAERNRLHLAAYEGDRRAWLSLRRVIWTHTETKMALLPTLCMKNTVHGKPCWKKYSASIPAWTLALDCMTITMICM